MGRPALGLMRVRSLSPLGEGLLALQRLANAPRITTCKNVDVCDFQNNMCYLLTFIAQHAIIAIAFRPEQRIIVMNCEPTAQCCT